MLLIPNAINPEESALSYLFPDAGNRVETKGGHVEGVKQAILLMYRRFDEPLSLQEMAEIALMSPHHFNRVFRRVTGLTPCNFLAAIRLRAATRLLLTTSASVTDICFAVGYNSLGTFTTRFTELIGLSPTQLRELAGRELSMTALCQAVETSAAVHMAQGMADSALIVQGRVIAPAINDAIIFVGLFPSAIPQGTPVACALLSAPGPFQTTVATAERYFAFAVAFPRCQEPLRYLLPDYAQLRIGMGAAPVSAGNGLINDSLDIHLRPIRVTDPPILCALPFLLRKQCYTRSDNVS
jgi:AraC-like DNA-binding protein